MSAHPAFKMTDKDKRLRDLQETRVAIMRNRIIMHELQEQTHFLFKHIHKSQVKKMKNKPKMFVRRKGDINENKPGLNRPSAQAFPKVTKAVFQISKFIFNINLFFCSFLDDAATDGQNSSSILIGQTTNHLKKPIAGRLQSAKLMQKNYGYDKGM